MRYYHTSAEMNSTKSTRELPIEEDTVDHNVIMLSTMNGGEDRVIQKEEANIKSCTSKLSTKAKLALITVVSFVFTIIFLLDLIRISFSEGYQTNNITSTFFMYQ